MKSTLILIGLLLGLLSYGQIVEKELSIHDLIQRQTDDIFDSLIKIRRDFHMNPELSGQEQMTSEKNSRLFNISWIRSQNKYRRIWCCWHFKWREK